MTLTERLNEIRQLTPDIPEFVIMTYIKAYTDCLQDNDIKISIENMMLMITSVAKAVDMSEGIEDKS